MAWASEQLFNSATEFFDAVIADVEKAQSSIEIEMYIFNFDELGQLILKHLKQAARRGVSVKILVDGVGSPHWLKPRDPELSELKIEYRVFHPIPWPYSRFSFFDLPQISKFWWFLSRMNRRLHKKVILIDSQIAYIGSINIMRESCDWRESGLRLLGEGVGVLQKAFFHNWSRGYFYGRKFLDLKFLPARGRDFLSDDVLLNYPLSLRFRTRGRFISKLKRANQRIWIMTPYFVPSLRMIRLLCRAAGQGVDVRLIIPGRTDVFLMKFVIPFMLESLLRSKIKVFEYLPSILHAKFIVIDDWAILGSSNMNQRSLNWDLEVDAVLSEQESKNNLKGRFLKDQEESRLIQLEDLNKRPIWMKILGRVFLLIKVWL